MAEYSLLKEPWIDVVTKEQDSISVGLIDLFKNAHTYERLNFSMPGFDLAVLRFLVALVYIVDPPETIDDWQEMLSVGLFSDNFIEGLKKYEDRLDLFHDKYPFMQNEINRGDKNITSVTALFKIMPGKTAPTHFNHTSNSLNYPLCPKCSLPALLATQSFSNSGGRANKENGESRSYLAGINGASPLFVYLDGKNLFESIILNVISKEKIEEMSEKDDISKDSDWSFRISDIFDVSVDDIGIIDGYLWQPRNVRFNLEDNIDDEKCIICGSDENKIIRNMDFRSGSHRIKDGLFWHDPMVSKIHKDDGLITRASLSGTARAEKSGWRDYASILYKEKKIRKSKIGDKTSERFIPIVLEQSSLIQNYENLRVNIFSLIVETASQPQIKKTLFGSYQFSKKLIDNDYMQRQLNKIVEISDSSQGALYLSLKTAYKDEINFSVSEKFWKELEVDFNSLLHLIINTDADIQPLMKWKDVLSKKLNKLFNDETSSLLNKSNFLVSIEKGRRALNGFIYKNLIEKGDDK